MLGIRRLLLGSGVKAEREVVRDIVVMKVTGLAS